MTSTQIIPHPSDKPMEPSADPADFTAMMVAKLFGRATGRPYYVRRIDPRTGDVDSL